jgi:hypothetical protein
MADRLPCTITRSPQRPSGRGRLADRFPCTTTRSRKRLPVCVRRHGRSALPCTTTRSRQGPPGCIGGMPDWLLRTTTCSLKCPPVSVGGHCRSASLYNPTLSQASSCCKRREPWPTRSSVQPHISPQSSGPCRGHARLAPAYNHALSQMSPGQRRRAWPIGFPVQPHALSSVLRSASEGMADRIPCTTTLQSPPVSAGGKAERFPLSNHTLSLAPPVPWGGNDRQPDQSTSPCRFKGRLGTTWHARAKEEINGSIA